MIQIRRDIIITQSFVQCVILCVNSICRDISIDAYNVILRSFLEKEKEVLKALNRGGLFSIRACRTISKGLKYN